VTGSRRRERGRGVFETLLVLLIVAAALLMAMERLESSGRSLKERALTIELANMRRAIIQHGVLEKRLPGSLAELVDDNMEVPSPGFQGERKLIIVGKFVETARRDDEGRPLDPFGSPYLYDPTTGRVWSQTPGYKTW